MRNSWIFVVLLSGILFLDSFQTVLAQDSQSGPKILNKQISVTYPWEISEGVKFTYRFANTPKLGTNALLDIDFSANIPNIQKATQSINQYMRSVEDGEREGFVYYFNSPVSIENIYATLDLTFYCEHKKGGDAVSRISVHRLLPPFTSYEFKSPGSRNFETFNKEIRGIKPENLLLDNLNQTSIPIPKSCVTLNLQRSSATIWVDYTNGWFVSYGGQRFKVTNPSSRLAVSSATNIGEKVSLINFASVTTPTAKASNNSSSNRVAAKPSSKSTPIKVVKEGSNCSPAGKITNVAGVSLVCAKVGSKLIWVSISGSTNTPSTPQPPTPSKSCSTNSSGLRSYVGTDSSQGINMTALIFENLTDCNLSVSATASFLCPDGGTLKSSNSVQSTGSFALSPKQKLSISLSVTRYFPLLTQQCFQLTGFRSNNPQIDTFYGGPVRGLILTSTP